MMLYSRLSPAGSQGEPREMEEDAGANGKETCMYRSQEGAMAADGTTSWTLGATNRSQKETEGGREGKKERRGGRRQVLS